MSDKILNILQSDILGYTCTVKIISKSKKNMELIPIYVLSKIKCINKNRCVYTQLQDVLFKTSSKANNTAKTKCSRDPECKQVTRAKTNKQKNTNKIGNKAAQAQSGTAK